MPTTTPLTLTIIQSCKKVTVKVKVTLLHCNVYKTVSYTSSGDTLYNPQQQSQLETEVSWRTADRGFQLINYRQFYEVDKI